jgi:hypothetical protein
VGAGLADRADYFRRHFEFDFFDVLYRKIERPPVLSDRI